MPPFPSAAQLGEQLPEVVDDRDRRLRPARDRPAERVAAGLVALLVCDAHWFGSHVSVSTDAAKITTPPSTTTTPATTAPTIHQTLAIGRESGIVRVIDRSQQPADLLREIDEAPTIDVVAFALRNASSLPDEFESEHVFRGAEYVAEVAA